MVQSCLYLALLISNALFFHVLTVWAAKRWFRASYANFVCPAETAAPVRHGAFRPHRRRHCCLPFPQPLQLLLIKDWRLLRRDPVQWSQFLIFFGLLGLYFLNVDRFNNPHSDIGYITWINMVSFLNLAVVGLILSTFTTRFIYPMISLEGHCFWILGLLPVERDTILWSKFWFASLGSWVPCALLVLLSDMMLQVPTLVIGVHQLTCVLLCLGLASIAVGFGAMMPNFRETSPSKIAAGFGGTLNLVLERAVHHGRGGAHRPALPFLSAGRQRAVGKRILQPAESQDVADHRHRGGDRGRRGRDRRAAPPRTARISAAGICVT